MSIVHMDTVAVIRKIVFVRDMPFLIVLEVSIGILFCSTLSNRVYWPRKSRAACANESMACA